MKILCLWFGRLIVLSSLVSAFIAYFIRTYDSASATFYDGFGRELSQTPAFLKLVLGQNYMWSGWVWFALDMVIFWGLIGLGLLIQNASDRFQKDIGGQK